MDKKPQKRKKQAKSLYSGELSKRMPPSKFGFLFPISMFLKSSSIFGPPSPDWIKDELAAADEKLLLLMDHYGIDRDRDDRWQILALALARDHVPAFNFAPVKGRPKKEIDKLRVYLGILTLSKEWGGRHSINRAISLYQERAHPDIPKKTVAGWFYSFREEGDKIMQEWEKKDGGKI